MKKGSTIELRMIDKLEKWLVGVILGIRLWGVDEVRVIIKEVGSEVGV